MKTIAEQIVSTQKNWFKDWFDSQFYHRLYAHRNDKEAADFVAALVSELQPSRASTMLDLGCGNGRHARYLAAKGFNVTGLDLSSFSIQHAKKSESASLQFYRHDMREPFGSRCFDYVFNFFTSFGYFNEQENDRVMRNISTALKHNGYVVLDYMNISFTERHLIPAEEKDIDGIIYKIKRWSDSKHIHKRIQVEQMQGLQPYVYTEQVLKAGQNDFKVLFGKNGLHLRRTFGDYFLNEFDEAKSPRLILLAQKIE